MCYCGLKKEFSNCCQPFIRGIAKAKTAEQLMRSRYSAYAIADINYLLNTHHKNYRPTRERKQILKWTKSVKWMGLNVISTQMGSQTETEGYVEFKATFEENGRLECIQENSYFVKENNTWYYVSGSHN